MKNLNLYHRDVYLPEKLLIAVKERRLRLEYSPTAREHAKHDALPIRSGITLNWTNTLEVASALYLNPDDSVEFVTVREAHDEHTDLVFTVKTDLRSGVGVVQKTERVHYKRPHFSAPPSEYISR